MSIMMNIGVIFCLFFHFAIHLYLALFFNVFERVIKLILILKVQKWCAYSNVVVCVSHSTWACLLMTQKKRQEKWHDNSQFPLNSSHQALIPFWLCSARYSAILEQAISLRKKKYPNFIAFVVFSFFIEFGWCTECADLIAKFSFENVKKDYMSLRACWCSDRISFLNEQMHFAHRTSENTWLTWESLSVAVMFILPMEIMVWTWN